MSQPTAMYCNTCKIAGKSQNEYTSHNTKTKNAKTGKVEVTCPVVLAAVCTYCNGSGHWKKYCKILEKDEKITKKLTNMASTPHANKAKPTNTLLTSNRFLVLGNDDDEPEEREDTLVKHQTQINPATPKVTWSSIVSKPAASISNVIFHNNSIMSRMRNVEFYEKEPARNKRMRNHNVENDLDEEDNKCYADRICFDMDANVGYMKHVDTYTSARPAARASASSVKKSWADYTSDDDDYECDYE